MTPASHDCLQRILARLATYPGEFWERWEDARSSGADRETCKRLERLAYQAEAFASVESERVRASFQSLESWAGDAP
jgi:hypothetical protein